MNNKNIELTILKAIGIIAVVSCHLGANIFNFIGIPISSTMELFPEYSYHMPLFVFASGYFYRRTHEINISKLVIKRFAHIKKYFQTNFFYFLLCFILVTLGLFSRDIKFTLNSLFIEPFLGGFQFYFNGPGWFVPFLVLLQILFAIIRKIIGLKLSSFSNKFDTSLKQEFILLITLTIIGIISASLSNIYPVINENVNILHSFLRILFGLPFFQLGFLYKEFIENKIDYSLRSFILIIIIKIVFYLIFGQYSFSLRMLLFYGHSILPFITSILGILYCLHLTRFIVKITNSLNPKILSFICFIGDNTWSIMMHHLFVKWCLLKIYSNLFISEISIQICSYIISPILCLLLPLAFAYLYDLTKNTLNLGYVLN